MTTSLNIILIILDAAARSHFNIYGYFRDTTPFLTSVAEESVIFHNAFCQGTDTVLSTASLFTSLYPIRHNVLSLNNRLPLEAKTLAEMLKEKLAVTAAYVTIPHLAKELGFDRGFDSYYPLFLDPDFFPRREITYKKCSLPILRWLEENQKCSFFLYFHIWQPHEPYGAPPPFNNFHDPTYKGKAKDGSLKLLTEIESGQLKLRQRGMQHLQALYDEGLRFADYQVQVLVEKLCQLDTFDNTILIITTDHGEGFLQHGKMLHSSTVYEELIQIPLIIKLPSCFHPRNREITSLVESIDLMPTLLELFEIPYANESFDGKSLVPLLFSTDSHHKEFVYSRSAAESPCYCIREERYKYIHHPTTYQKNKDTSHDELYDVRADPGEKRNLIEARPRVVVRMRKRLLEWMKEKRKGQLKPEKSQVEEKIKNQLRALGYLQ